MTRQELSGSRIKDEMTLRHLHRKDIREMLHYANDTQISPILQGRQPLTELQAETLAKAWGIRKEYLLGLDECQTEDDLIAKEFSDYKTTLSYFKSLGYEFRACYVWNASVIAAALGYEILAVYLSGESVLTCRFFGDSSFESKQELCKSLFDYAKKLNYSNICELSYKFNQTLDRNEFLNKLDTYLAPIFTHDNPPLFSNLGIFELSQNPFNSSVFENAYYATLCPWGEMDYYFHRNMLKTNELNKKSFSCDYSQYFIELDGFLSSSSIELRFAVSKNGILQSYVPFDDMRRIFATVDNTSTAVIGSMLK